MAPLLQASALRVDVAGVPQIDGLSLTTTGDHVLVLGAAPALFEAAAGLRPLGHGTLSIAGLAPGEAISAARVASAPCDPKLPAGWTPLDYATWSARLVGHERRDAVEHAREAIGRLRLDAHAGEPIEKLPLGARRATVLAAAIATGAGTIVIDSPTSGLPDGVARHLGKSLVTATNALRTVIFAGTLPLDAPLSLGADEAVVVLHSRVMAQGQPAEIAAAERRYELTVHGDAEGLARELARKGVTVSGREGHLGVELPSEFPTRELFAVANASNAVIVELRAVASTFR